MHGGAPPFPCNAYSVFSYPFPPTSTRPVCSATTSNVSRGAPPPFRERFVSASTTARLPLSCQVCLRPPSGLSSTIEAALEPHENGLFARCQLPCASPKWYCGQRKRARKQPTCTQKSASC